VGNPQSPGPHHCGNPLPRPTVHPVRNPRFISPPKGLTIISAVVSWNVRVSILVPVLNIRATVIVKVLASTLKAIVEPFSLHLPEFAGRLIPSAVIVVILRDDGGSANPRERPCRGRNQPHRPQQKSNSRNSNPFSIHGNPPLRFVQMMRRWTALPGGEGIEATSDPHSVDKATRQRTKSMISKVDGQRPRRRSIHSDCRLMVFAAHRKKAVSALAQMRQGGDGLDSFSVLRWLAIRPRQLPQPAQPPQSLRMLRQAH